MIKKVIGGAMILIAAALALSLGWEAWVDSREEGSGRRRVPLTAPSLVLITVDTTRADHLQPYNKDSVPTPNLLRLAQNGVLFEQAQATAPITLVAHTSILTGLYPPRHGVRNNGTHYVPETSITLAEILSERGFKTGGFISAAVLDSRYGLDQGFDVYNDDLSTGRERRPRVVPDRPAEATVDSAVAWLEELEPNDRYFLWVHFYDPHASYSPPAPFRDDYRGNLYDGEIAYMDQEIGRLLRHPRLAEKPPVIAVLGDHGESFGEHGEQTHAVLAYQATLHVPFLLKVPGGPRGLRLKDPVSQVDFLPTVLDLLGEGSQNPNVADGKSLVPLIAGSERMPNRLLYAETYLPYYTYGWAKLRTLRRGKWKYIESPNPELFDLRRDPRELSSQIASEPGLTHDLGTDLEQLLDSMGGADLETSLELDAESAEKLRSLGYLAVGSSAPPTDLERADPKEMVVHHVKLERARHFMQDGLFEPAISELRKVLDSDPANLAALIEIASALEQADRLDEALSAAKKALEYDPDYPRLYLLLAGIETRRGSLKEGLALIDVALELDPRHREANIQKAVLLRRTGRVEQAIEVLNLALENEPDDPLLNTHYARIAEAARGNLDAAEARLAKAAERDPFLSIAWLALGDVQEQLGKTKEALTSYRSGLERRPDGAELHGQVGMLLARQGGGQETEIHLREAIRLSKELRPDHAVALGAWLAEQGRFKEADELYARVLAVQPNHAAARNNRGIALYRTGKLKEAESELAQLVLDHPTHADAHNNLAAIAIDNEQFSTALTRAMTALRIAPLMPEAHNNRGLALAGLHRLDEAIAAFAKAVELDGQYWPARYNLGRVLKDENRASEAAVAFEAVLEQMPWHAECHLELGDLFSGPLDDPARARNHYNAFLRRAPDHPRAAEVRQRSQRLSL